MTDNDLKKQLQRKFNVSDMYYLHARIWRGLGPAPRLGKSRHHRNAVEMAFRWRAFGGPHYLLGKVA